MINTRNDLNLPVIILGVTLDNKFAYLRKRPSQVVYLTASRHKESELKGLGTTDEWLNGILAASPALSHLTERATQRGISYSLVLWDKVAEYLMDECRKRGFYDPAIARGVGLWRNSSSDFIYNTGQQLKVLRSDGRCETLPLYGLGTSEADPHHYLCSTTPARPFADEELTAAEGQALLQVLSRFSFARGENDAFIALGWVTCAPLLTLIRFRPQIAITAKMGSGKSELTTALSRMLGRNNCLKLEATMTTEPGLRQSLGHDARPVILDEFETSHDNATPMFSLFRSASNPSAGHAVKGTTGGQAIRYHTNTMACLAGITLGIEHPADQSRFAVLELKTRAHSEEERAAFADAIASLNDTIGSRLCRRALSRWRDFEETLKLFGIALRAIGMSNRKVDLFSHLLTGGWIACHDGTPTVDEAVQYVEWLREESEDEGAQEACLDFLLAQRLPREFLSVAEALAVLRGGNDAKEAEADLALLGIKYLPDEDVILVANKAPGILKLFASTPWRKGHHARELKRMGAGNRDNTTVRFGAFAGKCSCLPATIVFNGNE